MRGFGAGDVVPGGNPRGPGTGCNPPVFAGREPESGSRGTINVCVRRDGGKSRGGARGVSGEDVAWDAALAPARAEAAAGISTAAR